MLYRRIRFFVWQNWMAVGSQVDQRLAKQIIG
jgi:hypothetical protein